MNWFHIIDKVKDLNVILHNVASPTLISFVANVLITPTSLRLWSLHKLAAISQTTFLNSFSYTKSMILLIRFHANCYQWSCWWQFTVSSANGLLGVEQAPIHYLNQCQSTPTSLSSCHGNDTSLHVLVTLTNSELPRQKHPIRALLRFVMI